MTIATYTLLDTKLSPVKLLPAREPTGMVLQTGRLRPSDAAIWSPLAVVTHSNSCSNSAVPDLRANALADQIFCYNHLANSGPNNPGY